MENPFKAHRVAQQRTQPRQAAALGLSLSHYCEVEAGHPRRPLRATRVLSSITGQDEAAILAQYDAFRARRFADIASATSDAPAWFEDPPVRLSAKQQLELRTWHARLRSEAVQNG